MYRKLLMKAKTLVVFTALCCVGSAHAEMPKQMSFIAHGRSNEEQIVDVVEGAAGYTVSLSVVAKRKAFGRARAGGTVLLQGAQCDELPGGYHCFIHPVRVPGILVTDVNFIRTAGSYFDIKKIVLVDGSFTAMSLIGHDFELQKLPLQHVGAM